MNILKNRKPTEHADFINIGRLSCSLFLDLRSESYINMSKSFNI
ncbi:MAG: hypothetical protein JWR02_1240 [Mucilaginibacter sp.]|nr:hypothetical protein [Mucilaginibacter sp.]